MGRADSDHSSKSKSRKKSKGRMSYLRKNRQRRGGAGGGGGGGGYPRQEQKVDEFGQLYGDYESVNYHRRGQQQWRNGGGGGGYSGWRKPQYLKYGMKGFLCTTNFKERECVREAYNILNEYYDEEQGEKQDLEEKAEGAEKVEDGKKEDLNEMDCDPPAGPGTGTQTTAEVEESAECTEIVKEEQDASENSNPKVPQEDEPPKVGDVFAEVDGAVASSSKDAGAGEKVRTMDVDDNKREEKKKNIDIDDELANELKDLKSEKTVHRFQSVETGVNNVVFISTTIENPVELAYKIFDDVTSKEQTKTRNVLRFLPIELTCYASNMDEIKPKIQTLIEKYLKTGYLSYRIVFNSRLNDKVNRDDFILTVADMVAKTNPLSFVDLNDAQYTIAVEVLKSVMCIGIVKNFNKYKKYNLLEAGMTKLPPAKKTSGRSEKSETSNENTCHLKVVFKEGQSQKVNANTVTGMKEENGQEVEAVTAMEEDDQNGEVDAVTPTAMEEEVQIQKVEAVTAMEEVQIQKVEEKAVTPKEEVQIQKVEAVTAVEEEGQKQKLDAVTAMEEEVQIQKMEAVTAMEEVQIQKMEVVTAVEEKDQNQKIDADTAVEEGQNQKVEEKAVTAMEEVQTQKIDAVTAVEEGQNQKVEEKAVTAMEEVQIQKIDAVTAVEEEGQNQKVQEKAVTAMEEVQIQQIDAVTAVEEKGQNKNIDAVTTVEEEGQKIDAVTAVVEDGKKIDAVPAVEEEGQKIDTVTVQEEAGQNQKVNANAVTGMEEVQNQKVEAGAVTSVTVVKGQN